MLDIKTYSRRVFTVEAVQVTEENIEEVAEWCGGTIKVDRRGGGDRKYVWVPVHQPTNERQKMAYVTCWVLKSKTGFKVYPDKAMRGSFNVNDSRNVFDRNEEDPIASAEETPNPSSITGDGDALPREELKNHPTTRESLGFTDPREAFRTETSKEL